MSRKSFFLIALGHVSSLRELTLLLAWKEIRQNGKIIRGGKNNSALFFWHTEINKMYLFTVRLTRPEFSCSNAVLQILTFRNWHKQYSQIIISTIIQGNLKHCIFLCKYRQSCWKSANCPSKTHSLLYLEIWLLFSTCVEPVTINGAYFKHSQCQV